ncbi:type II secretion system minor pseudopilin GspK [Psychromonas sp. KJ10-10]|uniref:type II secretion system minor pseudopilin GspK n=1 Tax=Psychromonas sp. KJ10-10 TaxID=3391823 RepID=UPI0039B50023
MARSLGDFGRLVLDQDFSDSSIISLDQNWALPEMVFPLENGSIAGEFKDLRSCFNLNALAEKDDGDTRARPVQQFENLLIEIGVNDYSAEMIAESSRDWIDSDDQSDVALGAEDSIYQARGVPHLSADNYMVDITELRAVQGVGQKVFERIAPYLCAIPSAEQKINVNTVAVEQAAILYVIFKDSFSLTVDDFTELLEDRPVSGWSSVDDFLASSIFDGSTVSSDISNELSVTSEFFQLNAIAEFEDRINALQVLFQINDKKATVIRYQSGGFK